MTDRTLPKKIFSVVDELNEKNNATLLWREATGAQVGKVMTEYQRYTHPMMWFHSKRHCWSSIKWTHPYANGYTLSQSGDVYFPKLVMDNYKKFLADWNDCQMSVS